MKKIALTVAALAVTAGSALAADLPSRKGPPVLPPPPPPPLWTGFYVGLNAGGGWANSSTINTLAAPIFNNPGLGCGNANECVVAAAASANGVVNSSNGGGFIGGGQVGYNWQFYNSFLVGVEADIQGIAGGSSRNSTLGGAVVPNFGGGALTYTTGTAASRSIDYFGTVRGRLGWLATPTLLIYGTGGLAYGGVNLNFAQISALTPPGATANPFFGGAAFSDTRTGWTAGGGVEWMFWPNWSAKVEYLYYDLGRVSVNSAALQVNAAGTPFVGYGSQASTHFNGNVVRAGLNYHFNWGAPAPVVAKY